MTRKKFPGKNKKILTWVGTAGGVVGLRCWRAQKLSRRRIKKQVFGFLVGAKKGQICLG